MLAVYCAYVLGAYSLANGLEKLPGTNSVTGLGTGILGGISSTINSVEKAAEKAVEKVTDVPKSILTMDGLNSLPNLIPKKAPNRFSETESPNGSERTGGGEGSISSSDQFNLLGLGSISLNAGREESSNENGIMYSPYQPIYQGDYNEIPRYDQEVHGGNAYSDYYNYPDYEKYDTDTYSQHDLDPYSQYSADPYFEYNNSPTYQFNNDHYPVRNMAHNQSPYYEGSQYHSTHNPYFGTNTDGYY